MQRYIRIEILSIGICLAALAAAGTAHAADHDYFRNIQYPSQRRADVSLDKVEQEGGPDAVGYNKRVVTWWPKNGVDVMEPPDGVELRTWTIRTPEIEPLVDAGYFAKWWPADLKGRKQFKAHLIGFRGIGSARDNPFYDKARIRAQGDGVCPAVILRLEDGRKRCFTRGSFTDADQAYIVALYEKEMARVRLTLEPPPTEIPGDAASKPICKLYEPGTFRIESERFVIWSGSQEPNDGIPGFWINRSRENDAASHRTATLRMFEDYWAYNEYAGHLMPFWEKPVRYKYSVLYGGTLVNGTELIGRGNGGGYGGCSTACWEGLYHEWGHGFATDPMVLLGGGETRCDTLQTMADPSLVRKVSFQIQRPYKNMFWGQYPGGFGYTMLGDDPNWGYASVASFPCLMSEVENTPMHVIARLGQERGIWDNGIKGMGDFLGEIGARFAEYDYELEGMLREAYPAPNRSCLVALDRAKGLYRSTRTEAPEPFGFNVIRLTAEPGAGKITVDFRGLYDPDTYGDWRACIVACGANGRPRYTPLWNKGIMSMETREGDQRYWLTVTATPYALVSGQADGGGGRVNHVYQGGFTYKYPYEVQLTGCRPANPHAPIGANENMELIGPSLIARADANNDNAGLEDWPHPSDTPEYPAMKKTLETAIEKARVMLEWCKQDGLFTDLTFCPVSASGSLRLRMAASAVFLDWRAKWLLENAQGARHPNGGGWVARSAKVAPTVYVGAECMVLDGAQVLDQAILEDYAIVSGPKVRIKDHARVYGKAVVCGDVTLVDYARVCRSIINRSSKIEWNRTNPNEPLYKFQMVTGGPVKRDGPEERVEVFRNAGFKLQANYAFDRPETSLLEDWYQEHSTAWFAFGAHGTDLIFYDGVLYGQPGFEKDGEVNAFVFNGKDQYAEAEGTVADLATITVELAFKWLGGGEQTLFDFGSSTGNRFMLVLGASGEPALVMIRDGKRDMIAGSRAVPLGQWTTCRVEMDGRHARLWLNHGKVAEKASAFRAADVFPAGADKRNFIAATRDQNEFFKGSIDYLRIHSTVYDDFSKTPEPPMVSSRRIDPDFMQRFDKRYAGYDVQEARFKDDVRKLDIYRFYDEWNKKVDARIAELGSSDEVVRLERELKDLEARVEPLRNELGAAFDRQPGNADKRKRFDELEKQRQDRYRELQQASSAWTAAHKEEEEARKPKDEIEQSVRKKLEPDLNALNAKRREIDGKRNVYLTEKLNNDAESVKNRQDHEAVMNELKTVDEKTNAGRHGELMQRERQLNDAYGRRRDALIRDDSGWRDFDRESESVNQEEHKRIAGELDRDPGYSQALARERKARETREELERTLWSDASLVALEKEREAVNTRGARDAYLNKGVLEISSQINELKAKIKTLRLETALAQNPDEYQALMSIARVKDQYRGAIEDRMKARMLPLMPEDRTQMHQAAPFQMGKWSTRVDWDGRTPWEKADGELSPIMKRWLKRMKPYQTNKQ